MKTALNTYSVNIDGTIIVFDVSFKNTTPRADAVPDDELETVINIISISGQHITDVKERIKKHVNKWEPV